METLPEHAAPARRQRATRTDSGARPMAAGHAILGAVIAVGLVVGANALGVLDRDGGGGSASSFDFGVTTDSTTPTSVSETIAGGPETTASTGTAPATPAPTTVAADAGKVPTAQDPARVYIAGDSDAGNLGPPLESLLADTGVVTSKLFYKVSSGLTKPDFFDWPAQLKKDVGQYRPDIVVVTFGGNDAQDIELSGRFYPVSTPEWQTEYARRVGAVMDYLASEGRTLVWVGIPNAKSGSFRDRLDILQQVTRDVAAKHDHVVYIDTWDRFVGASGGYADYIIDPRDNKGKLVRADDGFHLNQTGAEILALDVGKAVVNELIARGAAISAPS